MARGVMRLPLVTFGLFSIFSGYFLALGDFGFDSPTLSVVGGTLVQLAFDQEE